MVQRQVEEIEQSTLLQKMVIGAIRNQSCRKVKDVVSTLQQLDKSLTQEEIQDAIMQLKNDNKITLLEQQVHRSFLQYIIDLYVSSSFWLTIVATVLTLTTIYLTPQVEPWSLIRIIAGGVFILLIPGYSLFQILFFTKDIDPIERIAISIGLSLAIAPLIGLMLNYTPWGIRLNPVIACLSTVSIALAFCGTYKRFLLRQKL